MGALLQQLGIELPIIQAGMGGGLAGHELAAAVADAGGLGTIGILGPEELRAEIAAVRRATDGPLAVNLLIPFARPAHFEAASEADVVVTFWGRPKRRTAKTWMHQCGSVEEALAARAAGADAVIAQGVEAGGHVRGTTAAMELLARVRAALPGNYPVLAAGGVADSTDVTARLEAGADAVVSGTRFLMSDESGAHPAYKERSREAGETILTELFGVGWPAQHRVIPNEATARWLRGDPRGPGWLRGLHAATAPFASRVPVAVQIRMRHRSGRAGRCSAPRPRPSGGRRVFEAGPLYAGECIDRIDDIRPAGELVRELAG